jgi:hypothetical protein
MLTQIASFDGSLLSPALAGLVTTPHVASAAEKKTLSGSGVQPVMTHLIT